MNWDALGAIGEVIGALAVVLTLIYLAVQVRQNSAAIRSSTRSDIARAQMDMNFIMATHPRMAASAYKLLREDGLDELDALGASHGVTGAMRMFENQFFAYREGNFSESIWLGYRANIEFLVGQPLFPGFWAERRHLFSGDFREFIDGLISD